MNHPTVTEFPALWVTSIAELAPGFAGRHEAYGKPLEITAISRGKNPVADVKDEAGKAHRFYLNTLVPSDKEFHGVPTTIFHNGMVVQAMDPKGLPITKTKRFPADTLFVVTKGNDRGDENASLNIFPLGGWTDRPLGYMRPRPTDVVAVEHGSF